MTPQNYHPPYLTTTSDATRRRMALAMGCRSSLRNHRRRPSVTARLTIAAWAALAFACGACAALAALNLIISR